MLRHWTETSYSSEELPGEVIGGYETLLPYIRTFLTSPHPYRKGAVCPFVADALRDDCVWFVPAEHNGNRAQGYRHIVLESIELFTSMTVDRKYPNASMVIFFSESYDLGAFLELHRSCVMSAVRKGYMLGALYSISNAQSIHDEHWFPLRTPIPTLVIRNMVSSDITFLESSPEHSFNKLSFIHSYLRVMGSRGIKGSNSWVRKAYELRRMYVLKSIIFLMFCIAPLILLAYLVL